MFFILGSSKLKDDDKNIPRIKQFHQLDISFPEVVQIPLGLLAINHLTGPISVFNNYNDVSSGGESHTDLTR
jgi:hypothetical protein